LHVRRAVDICVKRLEINMLEMSEVFDLLPMLYATESIVLRVTPLHDSGEEKNSLLNRSESKRKVALFWQVGRTN